MSKHTKCLPQHLGYRKHSRSISSYPTANKVLIHIRCLVIVVTDTAVSTTPVGDDTTLMSQIRKLRLSEVAQGWSGDAGQVCLVLLEESRGEMSAPARV